MAGSGHPHSIHSVGSENAAFVWDNAATPVPEISSGDVPARYLQAASRQGQLAATQPSSHRVCTRIGPDLMEATRDASRVVGAFLPEAIFTT